MHRTGDKHAPHEAIIIEFCIRSAWRHGQNRVAMALAIILVSITFFSVLTSPDRCRVQYSASQFLVTVRAPAVTTQTHLLPWSTLDPARLIAQGENSTS
jgi:hypothetical protein